MLKDVLLPMVRKITENQAPPSLTGAGSMNERLTRIEVALTGLPGQDGGGLLGEIRALRDARHQMNSMITELNGSIDEIRDMLHQIHRDRGN